jgi:hypothetical protein
MPLNVFYFGVLHPVARTLSRLLEEPSLATTFQCVCLYYIFILFISFICIYIYIWLFNALLLSETGLKNGVPITLAVVLHIGTELALGEDTFLRYAGYYKSHTAPHPTRRHFQLHKL